MKLEVQMIFWEIYLWLKKADFYKIFWSFSLEKIKSIKKYNLDVLIRFGFKILRGKILKSSKYGVWSYHHGDNNENRGGPAGYWEVFEGHHITGSVLQILNEDLDNGQILYRSFSAIIRNL